MMDEVIPLPPGDADGDLARRIGDGEGLSGTDAFQRALLEYQTAARKVSPQQGFSERLWSRVASAPALRARSRLRVLPLWLRWSAATAAVLLITVGIWSTYPSSRPVVASAVDASTTTVLDDGSLVTLRPHTTLYRVSADRYELVGEAFFDVVHNPSREFSVRAGFGEVRVLGTRFDVRTWGNETAVFLERGQVAFRHLQTGVVDTLAPGDELVAGAMGLSVTALKDEGAGSLDWMTDALVFGERPLERILAEVEHHFNIAVFVPDSLKTETLSGRISLSSASRCLYDLAVVLGGRFAESRPNVFTFFVE